MPEPSNFSAAHGADEKTEVLPETAVQLVEMERLKSELLAAEERAKNHWEQYLRALAEVDNVRKRGAKDLESTRQFAIEKFAQDLVAVIDSLELAIANSGKADAAPASSRAKRQRCGCWPRPSRRPRSKRSIRKASHSIPNFTKP